MHNEHYMLRLASPASDWAGCGRRGGAGAGGRHGGNGWWLPGFGAGFGRGGGWGGHAPNMRKFWRNFMRTQPGEASATGES